MKALMTTASAEALEVANNADRADIARFVEELSDNIEFYRPNAEEFEQWRNAAMGIWSQFTDSIDPEILARVQAAQD